MMVNETVNPKGYMLYYFIYIIYLKGKFIEIEQICCLVTKSCPTLCNPMDCSSRGFPVFQHLLELAQTHIH